MIQFQPMINYLRWILAAPLLSLFLWAALFNLWVVLLICRNLITGERKRVPSFAPFIGGLAGVLGLYLCPLESLSGYEWLPLLLDLSTLPYLAVVLHALFHLWAERRRPREG